MRKTLTIIFAALHIAAFAQESKFIPDSTVNGKILLFDEDSVLRNLGNLMHKINRDASLPDIYFCNKNSTEYLRLIFFPGCYNNCFARFEISKQRPKARIYPLKRFNTFLSESNLRIGTKVEDIIQAKGNSYSKVMQAGYYILRYQIDDMSSSDFLTRYNMPSFTQDFYIKNGKLYKLSYGFDYP